MQLYVLSDDNGTIYCVTDDASAADKWANLKDPSLLGAEIELNDFTLFNQVVEQLEVPE